MQNEQIREAIDTHWRALAAGDADAEHDIYEYTINYSGLSSHTVSIMEFRNGKVVQETQYFADPFVAPAWRSRWVQHAGWSSVEA
jgi:hypothetical protein